jgi:hypothetical protein
MTPSDGFWLRPPNPDELDERLATFEDELDLARLVEERTDMHSCRGSLGPYDQQAADRARRDVYGVARREEAHES